MFTEILQYFSFFPRLDIVRTTTIFILYHRHIECKLPLMVRYFR